MNSKEITAHLDRLCVESGIKGMQLIAAGYASREDHESKFIAYTPGQNTESGATAEEAIAKFKEKMKTPAQLAVEKREQAQKLVLEAERLEREASNA